jgi:hypothetical protein
MRPKLVKGDAIYYGISYLATSGFFEIIYEWLIKIRSVKYVHLMLTKLSNSKSAQPPFFVNRDLRIVRFDYANCTASSDSVYIVFGNCKWLIASF